MLRKVKMITKQEVEQLITDAEIFHRTYWPEYIEFKKSLEKYDLGETFSGNIPEEVERRYNKARPLIQSSKLLN